MRGVAKPHVRVSVSVFIAEREKMTGRLKMSDQKDYKIITRGWYGRVGDPASIRNRSVRCVSEYIQHVYGCSWCGQSFYGFRLTQEEIKEEV